MTTSIVKQVWCNAIWSHAKEHGLDFDGETTWRFLYIYSVEYIIIETAYHAKPPTLQWWMGEINHL